MESETGATWASLVRAHAAIRVQIERALAPFELSVATYGVLSALSSAARSLSLTEVADIVGLSRPRVSRLVDQMILDGLVTRVTHPSDSRARLVDITDSGERRFREASVAHRTALHSAIGSKLSQARARGLCKSLEELAKS